MKTILILLTFCLPLCAQNLLEKTPAQQVTERLDASQAELIRHIESQLCSFYSTLANPATAQAILDAFGPKAIVALQRYTAARAFVVSLDPTAASRIPAPDLTVFKANADGTVTFVPPPIVVKPPVEDPPKPPVVE